MTCPATMNDKRSKLRRTKRAAGKIQKRLNKNKFQCLCPGCSQVAVSSHSQQKEGQLRAIAKDGLVYALNRNFFQNIKKTMNGHFGPSIAKIGIHEASTFSGYCSQHDGMIFGPIEKYPLTLMNPEQAALLFLRAISLEYSVKRQVSLLMAMFAKAVEGDSVPQWQEFISEWLQGVNLFLEREGPFFLGQIFDLITKKEYSKLHTSWRRLPIKLPISLSTGVCPWLNEYYDKWSYDRPQAMVSFSIIPATEYTDVICSWLDYCDNDAAWIKKEMTSIEGVERVINILGIAESEDICINIDFWESLPQDLQEFVLRNIQHDIIRGPLSEVPIIIRV
jgi:hypothetical protein